MSSSLILPGMEGYAKRDESLGQWDTHPEVCSAFVRWAGVTRGMRVLEPCAGIGNLAAAILAVGASVTAIEIDEERSRVLASRMTEPVLVGDFLQLEPRNVFDVSVGNPPYEKDGETRFVERALLSAPRACMIVRLVALSSERRAEAWERVEVRRVAHLVPRPVFAGSSGMDEIIFVDVRRRPRGVPPGPSTPSMEWLRWREVSRSAP